MSVGFGYGRQAAAAAVIVVEKEAQTALWIIDSFFLPPGKCTGDRGERKGGEGLTQQQLVLVWNMAVVHLAGRRKQHEIGLRKMKRKNICMCTDQFPPGLLLALVSCCTWLVHAYHGSELLTCTGVKKVLILYWENFKSDQINFINIAQRKEKLHVDGKKTLLTG